MVPDMADRAVIYYVIADDEMRVEMVNEVKRFLDSRSNVVHFEVLFIGHRAACFRTMREIRRLSRYANGNRRAFEYQLARWRRNSAVVKKNKKGYFYKEIYTL